MAGFSCANPKHLKKEKLRIGLYSGHAGKEGGNVAKMFGFCTMSYSATSLASGDADSILEPRVWMGECICQG